MKNLIEESYASYVNLDHRQDRLVRTVGVLRKMGITAERTRGMLPSEYVGPKERIKCMLSRPQKGAIGCHFSQVKIMEEAGRRGQHAFVMEDDLVFCQDFWDRIEHISAFCRTHPWDVIWLGGTFHVNPPYWHKARLGRDAATTDDPRMIRTYGAFSTHAYIVNCDSISKCLSMIDAILPTSMGIDWAFIQIEPELHTYSYVPGCVIQIDNQSDIGKGITRYSQFEKLGPHWYADYKEQFDPTKHNWHEAKVV